MTEDASVATIVHDNLLFPWCADPSVQRIKNASLLSKRNDVGINAEADHSSSSAIPAGAVNGLDRTTKPQCPLLVIDFHATTIGREDLGRYGVFTPQGDLPLPSRPAADQKSCSGTAANANISPEMNNPRSSLREELANSIISGVGFVFAVAGSIVLVARAGNYGTARHIVSCSVYGVTLIFLYAASTLYHGIHFPRAKAILRVFDHSAIFLLIAGTYTPFTLVSLRGAGGWSLFGVIWGLAALGITFQAWLRRRPVARVGLYVGMGWAVVVAVRPLFATVAPGGLLLLLAGGLAYTTGIGFYAWRRLPYHHAIWHAFVLAGSISHFFAILFYVIPTGL